VHICPNTGDLHTSVKYDEAAVLPTVEQGDEIVEELEEDSEKSGLLVPTLGSMMEYASGVYCMYRAGKSLNTKINYLSPLKVQKLWSNFNDSRTGEELEYVAMEEWADDAAMYATGNDNLFGLPQIMYDALCIPFYQLKMLESVFGVLESAGRIAEVLNKASEIADSIRSSVQTVVKGIESAFDKASSWLTSVSKTLEERRMTSRETAGIYDVGSKASHGGFGGDIAFEDILYNMASGFENQLIDVLQELISKGALALDEVEDIATGFMNTVSSVAETVHSVSETASQAEEGLNAVAQATQQAEAIMSGGLEAPGKAVDAAVGVGEQVVSNPLEFVEQSVEDIVSEGESFVSDPGHWLANLARTICGGEEY
jgi:hypothetical protein